MVARGAGVLGDAVKVSKDKSKITVTTETAFSKRWAVAPRSTIPLVQLKPRLHVASAVAGSVDWC